MYDVREHQPAGCKEEGEQIEILQTSGSVASLFSDVHATQYAHLFIFCLQIFMFLIVFMYYISSAFLRSDVWKSPGSSYSDIRGCI